MNERYSRQTSLAEFGPAAQQTLGNSKVAVVGCGGLGAIAAGYLAGAGVGTLILIDGDSPELSNLHRQILYAEADKDKKSTVLKNKLERLNSSIRIIGHEAHLTKENIDEFLMGADLILECSDSVMCKYLVNDFCHLENIPLVYGAIYKFEGYVSLFRNESEESIHLRDIHPQPNINVPTCSEVGVFNTIAGIIGVMQANEALKYLSGLGSTLVGSLLHYNCLDNSQLRIKLKKHFRDDLEEMYEGSNYQEADCTYVPEIEVDKYFENPESYRLYSVMAADEHKAIEGYRKHYTEIDTMLSQWKETGEPVVFYCRSGRVSKQFVQALMDKYPSTEAYSLAGGYKAYQKFKVLN